MITVSIVEDDKDICQSLAMLINSTLQFKCTHTYNDCTSGIAGVIKDPPDVVLMDIGLPDMSGIEGIKKIKEKLPEMDIIVLTVHENDEYVFDALCAGACGYLVKDTPTARILDAIKDVADGGAPMSTQIARMVVHSFQKKTHTLLTQRETEVLQQLCTGKSYKMIADILFISEETVRRHLKSIYKKLEVHSKSEAVAKALKEKLV
ncbi:response regulator transcription factor [bacterium]|nr:response regulator transcription factor [bacterium]